jgi:Divergent InlB B-repeat domain
MRLFARLRLVGLAVICLLAVVAAPGASGEPAKVPLRVAVVGTGLVTIPAERIGCRRKCSAAYDPGAVVELRAVAGRDFVFGRWAGDCVGTARACVVALDRATTVRALFVGKPRRVRMTVGGPGRVVSRPKGLLCGRRSDRCYAAFNHGTVIRLTASAASGGAFAVWGGSCRVVSTGTCRLFVGSDMDVSAAFRRTEPTPPPRKLTIRLGLGGRLRVTSEPPGIDCPTICEGSFPLGTLVTLNGSGTLVWADGCVGSGATCAIVLDESVVVDVVDPPDPAPSMGINVAVSGRGLVLGPGIRCGATTGTLLDCEGFFGRGATVLLQAIPRRGSYFAGWRGFCTGTEPRCTLRATAPKTVLALFRR